MRPLIARIDLAALRSNYLIAQQAAPKSKNFAVIKADAYGHGSVVCANALDQAHAFAVATVEEGIELRVGKIQKPILILSSFSQQSEIQALQQYHLTPVIHSLYQLEMLISSIVSKPLAMWLKVDTGMNRLGFNKKDLNKVFEKIDKAQNVRICGMMSHLACSDELNSMATDKQVELFNSITQNSKHLLSMANSCAVLTWPKTHYDWNRPGIMLYGTTSLATQTTLSSTLKPVMTLQSELISIKNIQKGQPVGYGHSFVADNDMVVGIVACGYADGYPRAALTNTPVLVSGQRSRIIGRVSMDTLAVDLTDIPNSAIGDVVILWGKGLDIVEVSNAAQTIPYELLTRVSKRVPRVYID